MVSKYTLILVIALCHHIGFGQILTFEFSSLAGNEPTANTNFNDANLMPSTISRGTGLVPSTNGGRFNATQWTTSPMIDLNDYMEFTITPTGGYQFSVSSIYIQLERSDAGPREIAIRSSLDGYTSNLDSNYIIIDNTNTQNYTFTFSQPNSNVAITYRIYMYNSENNLGSGGIGDGAGNDIEVYGAVYFPTNCTPIFEDDFNSGLGLWSNTADWTTTAGELQHNISTGLAGDSYIYTDLGVQNLNAANYQWQFCMRNDNWNPSQNNNFTYYLITDSPTYLDVNTVNGYAVGVNRTGTVPTDELVLYSVVNGNHSVILTTLFNWDNNDDVCLRVTRNTSGLWELFYNTNSTGEISAGTVTNNNQATGRYTGVFFEYTSSNANELWVDDVSVCRDLITVGPELQIVAVGGNQSCGYTLDFGNVESNVAFLDLRFYIKNVGSANLEVSNITITGADASEFSLVSPSPPPNITITPGGSEETIVRFTPTSIGSKTATLTIGNNDSDEFSCAINLFGQGVVNSGVGPLMISQYYEGTSTNKWIEIANISNGVVNASAYYLAAYNQYNSCFKEHLNGSPTSSMQLPNINMAPSDIILLKEPTATEPMYASATANMFPASFSGDDIIIISTTNDANSFKNRIDIIGEYSSPCGVTYWGQEKSYVRNQCASVGTDITFYPDHWIIYDYSDNDVATTAGDGTNTYLGQHRSSVTFTGSGPYSGWTIGLPQGDVNAVVASDYNTSVNGSFSCCSLSVGNNATLNIDDSDYVSLHKNLSIDAGSVLDIQNEGQLVMTDDLGTVTNNGSGVANVYKTTTVLQPFDYVYWSSPINYTIPPPPPLPTPTIDMVLGSVFGGDFDVNHMYTFRTTTFDDDDNDGFDDDQNDWVHHSTIMNRGIGYATMTANTNAQQNHATFSGTLNSGIINVDVDLSEDADSTTDDWNLIGNPYPSAISADSLIAQNSNIDGTIYFWTHNTPISISNPGPDVFNYSTNDYAMYNFTGGVGTGTSASSGGKIPTGRIASGQGFFVEAIDASIDVVFNNSMRSAALFNDDFFRTAKLIEEEEKDRLWLNLTNPDGAFSQILIGFFADATLNKDRLYDGIRKLGTNYIDFLSYDNSTNKYAIQGRPLFNEVDIIKIGYSSHIMGNLTIALDERNGILEHQNVFLIDHQFNEIHDLTNAPYTFSTEIGYFNNRFEIAFTEEVFQLEDAVVSNHDLQIIELNNDSVKFKLNGQHTMHTITIIDLLGRTLYLLHGEDSSEVIYNLSNLSQAVYIAQVELSNGQVIAKKAVKRK